MLLITSVPDNRPQGDYLRTPEPLHSSDLCVTITRIGQERSWVETRAHSHYRVAQYSRSLAFG